MCPQPPMEALGCRTIEHRAAHQQQGEGSRFFVGNGMKQCCGVCFSSSHLPLCSEAFPGCCGICFEAAGINSQPRWEGGVGEGRMVGLTEWKWFINENIVLFVEGRVNFARTPLRLR